MSTPYGRQVIGTTGEVGFQVVNSDPRWKVGGITIDWSVVFRALADVALNDQNTVLAGNKYLRYGQVVTKITASGKYGPYTPAMSATTLNGAVLLGALTITLTAVANLGPGDSLHIAAGGGTAEDVIVKSIAGSIVTLDAPLVSAHADTTAVTKPDDGRQTIARGSIFIINQTVLEKAQFGLNVQQTDSVGVLEGGRVYKERILQSGVTASTIVLGPTLANLESAFPLLTYVG